MEEEELEEFKKQQYRKFYRGGPGVFPSETSTGMSLRDWFAGRAMQGILSSSRLANTSEEICKYAYIFADAMLKARERAE